MHADEDLARLQRWMQAVIMHPGGVEIGIDSQEARQELQIAAADVQSVIPGSRALSSVERLEIYSRAYTARLIECLKSQFPVLAKALGEPLFDQFAAGYLAHNPSRSYTLGRLGENFVRYLSATKPTEPEAGCWPDFLIDLARLEWEFDQVFDGTGVEEQPLLTAVELQSVPPAAWPSARLVLAPCLRLLKLDHPVHEYYRALRRDEPASLPARGPTWLAITRREYIVRYYSLSAEQHQLLEAFSQGSSLGGALSELAATRDDLERLLQELQGWFRYWSREGFFWKVEAR